MHTGDGECKIEGAFPTASLSFLSTERWKNWIEIRRWPPHTTIHLEYYQFGFLRHSLRHQISPYLDQTILQQIRIKYSPVQVELTHAVIYDFLKNRSTHFFLSSLSLPPFSKPLTFFPYKSESRHLKFLSPCEIEE